MHNPHDHLLPTFLVWEVGRYRWPCREPAHPPVGGGDGKGGDDCYRAGPVLEDREGAFVALGDLARAMGISMLSPKPRQGAKTSPQREGGDGWCVFVLLVAKMLCIFPLSIPSKRLSGVRGRPNRRPPKLFGIFFPIERFRQKLGHVKPRKRETHFEAKQEPQSLRIYVE